MPETKQFNFDGELLIDLDPAKIGPGNYRKLQNMRYTNGAPEGVLGYSKINTTALTTYTNIRTGHQLRSDRTLKSYVLAHAQNSSGEGKVYQNQTTIPDQGDFEASVLHTDATGHGLGRFSDAPGGNVTYCNEKESMIWAGNEMRIGAFYLTTDGTYDGTENPVDRTEAINNTLDDTANVASIGTQKWWLILTTRPLKGVKFYVKTANDTASTMTVKYYNGSWSAVGSGADGTRPAAISLAQTGVYSFDSTTSDAKPFHYQGNYLYGYQFQLSAGTATVSHVSADAPFQDIVDVWDGVFRQPIQVQAIIDSKQYDYTLAANETSNTDIPIGADFGATDHTDDSWTIMFDDRMAGINFTMLAGLVNTNAANATVKYWNGSAYVDTSATDGTSLAGDTMGQTGLMSWNPPAASSEAKRTLFGTNGYAYEITFSATLSGAAAAGNVVADLITGVPAQNTVPAFKFSSKYKNRSLLCANTAAKEGGRVDYSLTNGPDVYNGAETSEQGYQSLFFGGVEDLTCGIELYNRFGSNIYATWLGLKNNETYLLTGDGPENFRIFPISYTVGCPAPETLVAAELGFEMADNIVRNIAIWLDYSGPVIFDGAVIRPIGKIDKYFDPAESVCVNFDAISAARGWYDPAKREYNLQIPTGTSTTNNVWLVYDLIRKRWFTKYTGTGENVQCAFPVRDTYGTNYMYGGIDTGYMMRLENGTSYDGAGIEQTVEVGDFWPTGSIWDISQITRIKLIAKRIVETHSVGVTYFSDTAGSAGVGAVWTDTDDVVWTDTDDVVWTSPEATTLSLNLDEGLNRLVRTTTRLTDSKGWTHGFGFTVTTTNATKAFKPIAWGIEFIKIRQDV